MRVRAILFIDGNNFYHGMKRIGAIRELNYEKISEKLLMGREWVETRFYVGELKQEGNHDLYLEQQQFLDELEQYSKVSTHLGRMESRQPNAKGVAHKLNSWLDTLPSRSDLPELPEKVIRELRKIARPEKRRWVEKAVDVMIATDMVSMAHEDKYDVAYLLSADGDFVPAITKVRDTGRKVIVASPVPGYKVSQAANVFIPLKREFFHGCWK